MADGPLDAARVAANLREVREEARSAAGGRDVRVLAAVKYLESDEVGVLAAAGVTLVGENRAQELERKATAHPELEWHFIGRLQSRKVRAIVPYARLIHSVCSDSALAALARHGSPDTRALVEVNVAGDPDKDGVAPDELERFLERASAQGVPVDGLMTMPPLAADPEQSRRWFAALRELAARHGLAELSMGTSQDFAVAAGEGATIVRVGSRLLR